MNFETFQKRIKKKPNTKLALALYMGYTSTDAIDKWLKRGNIARHKTKLVTEFFKQLKGRNRK